jgi:MoaA/NifB/PqqE/SkfB family radical SAM enzyme
MGPAVIILTGGEPLLRDDIFEITAMATAWATAWSWR